MYNSIGLHYFFFTTLYVRRVFAFCSAAAKVDVPWLHLGSEPVTVLLEGLCLLVGPLDKDSWGDDEVKARRLGTKRSWLKNAEAEALTKKKGKEEKEDDDQKVPQPNVFTSVCLSNVCKLFSCSCDILSAD